jgi:exodeoxyribonuclease-5
VDLSKSIPGIRPGSTPSRLKVTKLVSPARSASSEMVLTDGQSRALVEILEAQEVGTPHLLTGFAGSGKTTLMQEVAKAFCAQPLDVVVTAPTHKAVSVLARKIQAAGLGKVDCITIHSLLSLKPVAKGPKVVLERDKRAKLVTADVVIIDECSMVSAELLQWIEKQLSHCFVLFVGDPAQLPPVGEVESGAFATLSRSHLDTIVRQAAGNPILDVAHAIRRSQGNALDWSWCRDARSEKQGVFVPRDADRWIKQAFTSDKFKTDNDQYRYLCWTNERVAEINSRVRLYIYGGETPTPFMPGERVLMRAPVFRDNATALATNEEAEVVSIAPSVFNYHFAKREHLKEWVATLPSWRVQLKPANGPNVHVHMMQDMNDLAPVQGRLVREAKKYPIRWHDRYSFLQSIGQMQAVYAMTVHCSQGSTFGHAFVDIADIKRRARSNVLETQQLLYVAATRPSQALVLVNTGTGA